jgi:beta-glucosidase
MGEETKAKGAHILLGPTVNIQRSPLGGRGFESFSEDPVLSGYAAASIINGLQEKGIAATIKHFVCNDQEHQRLAYSATITERALREIYLMAFQIAIRDSDPAAIMTAYNKVNGVHVSENPILLKKLLRDEWKWNGTIMSDW